MMDHDTPHIRRLHRLQMKAKTMNLDGFIENLNINIKQTVKSFERENPYY